MSNKLKGEPCYSEHPLSNTDPLVCKPDFNLLKATRDLPEVSPKGKHDCVINPQKIHILYSKIQELCSETLLEQELDKMQSVMIAKREFNQREDIVFYMTPDDLFKVQNSKSPVYIRLRPEQPSSKITAPYIESIKTPTSERVDKKRMSDGGSSVLSHSSLDSLHHSSRSDGSRKSTHRSNSINTEKLNRDKFRSSSPPMRAEQNLCLDFERKNINVNGVPWNVTYKLLNDKYYVFAIEKKGVEMMCRGLKEEEINALPTGNMKGIPVRYSILPGHIDTIEFQIYTLDINNISLPIYITITTIDYTCKIKDFVGILEELLQLARARFNENR